MNTLQKKLMKINVCTQAVEEAGKFRSAKQAWHGWRCGEDLLLLLVMLSLPKKRLRAVREAYYAAAAAKAAWAARAAELGGVMTCDDAQAALADLVRREVPWEEVRELWGEKTAN